MVGEFGGGIGAEDWECGQQVGDLAHVGERDRVGLRVITG